MGGSDSRSIKKVVVKIEIVKKMWMRLMCKIIIPQAYGVYC